MILGFFDKIRQRRSQPAFDAPLEVPGRVYAIGDVHGCATLLERMVERIAAECRADGVAAQLVMMGDYVDRGDDARATLDLLEGLRVESALAPVLLAGNHEKLLLDFIEGRDQGRRWLRFGGLQTLLSYGVGGGALAVAPGDEAADRALRAELEEAMGSHLDLLRGLDLSHRVGNVFFSHAGADPDRALDLQDERALIWGAPGFLDRPRADGQWVVHGHFIVDEPTGEDGRIAIDTGAYFSQRLTAVCLEAGTMRFLSTADKV